jgi:hypothetical protein
VYFTTPSKYTIMLLGKICSNENIMQWDEYLSCWR